MVEGSILFRIDDLVLTGHDVPQLVRDATTNGPHAATRLYQRLTEVNDQVVQPLTRRQRNIDPDDESLVRAEGQRLYQRGAFLNTPTICEELQALAHGLSDLAEYLNENITLRSVHTQSVPLNRDLFLYATFDKHQHRYRAHIHLERIIDRTGPIPRIGSVRETQQELSKTDLSLEAFLALDQDAARYVLTVPPHITFEQDLVRLFLKKFVDMKRRIWREGLDAYPVIT